jgi:uncharacterized peroxidase-related enzyme
MRERVSPIPQVLVEGRLRFRDHIARRYRPLAKDGRIAHSDHREIPTVAQRTKTVAKKRSVPIKRAPLPKGGKDASAHEDDVKFMALDIRRGPLSEAMTAYFAKCQEKLGYVPNVLRAYGFDNGKLQAFADYRQELVQNAESLSKLEIEMIATAVSSQNRCFYCITVHGNSVRTLSGDPILGEMMVQNYRAARLSKRQRAMLDFAVKLTIEPWAVEEEDRERLRKAGFRDRDIWDIASIAAFYNMTNRLASATDMRPNSVYHGQAR